MSVPVEEATRQRYGRGPGSEALEGAASGTARGGQYCTFRLGELMIGIDVHKVQEVIRHERMTPVPLAPPEIVGLINLRGEIVPALDLRAQLGLPVAEELSASVLLKTRGETVSLLVAEVGDVVEPSPSDYEPVPPSVSARVREVVTGTFKLEGMLLLVLDPDRVLAHLGSATPQAR